MQCPVCAHTNADDAKFCSQCGTALARTCRVCSNPLEADARFCSNCGTPVVSDEAAPPADDLSRYVPETLLRKIRAARAGGSMRGERRTVTMLFADIQGSTAAAEHLDPEEWADIVNGAFEHLITPVYRYEGTLARLQGDAILAFFGAPIAHEDDPVRAVHAGLEMLEAIQDYAEGVRRTTGVPIAVRVGINTGLVVVGEVGSDLRVEYTALGDAINVAARMEQTAEPGTVRITQDTADLLGGEFTTTLIGPVEVKGRADAVDALRVDGVVVAEDLVLPASPIVGRRDERTRLAGLVDHLLDGVGGVATVVGDAGIGKSRLLAAVRAELDERHDVANCNEDDGVLAWMEGHCRSFDTSVPYAPFLDLAGRWLHLAGVPEDAIHDRIAAAVAAVTTTPDPDAAAYLSHIAGARLPADAAELINALETPVLHERATDAVVAYLEAEAERRPVVIVLEDLHWADALSLALAERLVASTERVPIGLILAMRPARDDPSWRLVEVASRDFAHLHMGIELEPLSDDATEALLDLLLGGRTITSSDRDRILHRADGNPLFVEQIVGSFGDDEAREVPASLAGLLSARLDRLDEDERLVTQIAATVGHEFGPDDVAALATGLDTDAAIHGLVRRGVFVERRRRPQPLYAFRHALIQETAYSTMLLKDRRDLHGRLARHLVATGRDDALAIARHFRESDTPDAAFPWLVEAGRRATRVMALGEAIDLLATAVDNVPADADPAAVADAHLALGEAYSLVPDLDQASRAYQSLAEYGRATDRPVLQVQALNRLGMAAAHMGADLDAAKRYLESARTVAESAGDELGLAEYHMNACFIAVAEGRIDQALEHDTETARLGGLNGADQIRVTGLVRRALNLINLAEFDAAAAAIEEAKAVAAEVGAHEELAVLTGNGEAMLRERGGDLTGSAELLASSGAVLDRFGSFYSSLARHHEGRTALWLGDLESALALLSEAVRVAEHWNQAFAVGSGSATLALAYAICGDDGEAARNRARALDGLGVPVGDFLASTVWADLGFASIELGDWETAEADFAVGLQTSSSSRFLERPRLLLGAARVGLERGQADRGRALLDEARDYIDERGMENFRPLLDLTAAQVARSDGDLATAEALLATAEAAAGAMKTRWLAHAIAATRAEIAHLVGRGHDADQHRRAQAGYAAEILALIADPVLRDRVAMRLGASTVAPPGPAT
jgi:class 3 adenylate cyclase/tetratricopeptide (TPR) repeat protein